MTKKTNLPAVIDYNFLRIPIFKEFKGLIKSIKSNDVIKYKFKWYLNSSANKDQNLSWKNNKDKGGGVLYNFGSHIFSICIFFFGDQISIDIPKKNYNKSHFNQRIKINIKEGWRNQETGRLGDPRIQFINFEMLHDALSKNSKKLTLQLDIRQLKSESIQQLKKELNGFKGDKLLYFDVIDPKKQLKLTLASRKQKVAISPELLSHLEEKRWHYKLN